MRLTILSVPGSALEKVHEEASVGLVNSVTWHHFHFQHGDYVRSVVKARNGAGNDVEAETDGYDFVAKLNF